MRRSAIFRNPLPALLVTLAALTLAACGGAGHPLAPYFDAELGQFVVQYEAAETLVQRLQLSHTELAPGDTLRIVSTVVNRGSEPADVTARVCGLDLRTDLSLREAEVRCSAYSSELRLMPGDSAWAADGGIVVSRPGRYTLRVRHILDPQAWIEVRIRVREAQAPGDGSGVEDRDPDGGPG